MLPYLAQGANSAIEDGAVLGLLLGSIKSREQLPKALQMYQQLRKARGDAIVKETFKQVCGPIQGTLVILGNLTLCYPSETRSICAMAPNRRPEMNCFFPSLGRR